MSVSQPLRPESFQVLVTWYILPLIFRSLGNATTTSVVKVDGEFCSVRKFTNTQLCEPAVRVKKAHCFHVPSAPLPVINENKECEAEVDEDVQHLTTSSHNQCTSNTSQQTLTDFNHEPPHHADDPFTEHLSSHAETDPANLPSTPLVNTENSIATLQTGAPLEVPQAENIATALESTAPRRTQRHSRRPGYLDDYEC